MTQAEKLEALMWRAITNGWQHWAFDKKSWFFTDYDENKQEWYCGDEHLHINAVIFDKDFARALFGEKTMGDLYREDSDEYLKVAKAITWVSGYEWDYEAKMFELYLQGAVISDNPIDYMYKAVFGDN